MHALPRTLISQLPRTLHALPRTLSQLVAAHARRKVVRRLLALRSGARACACCATHGARTERDPRPSSPFRARPRDGRCDAAAQDRAYFGSTVDMEARLELIALLLQRSR
jgi:hypothetical protein